MRFAYPFTVETDQVTNDVHGICRRNSFDWRKWWITVNRAAKQVWKESARSKTESMSLAVAVDVET